MWNREYKGLNLKDIYREFNVELTLVEKYSCISVKKLTTSVKVSIETKRNLEKLQALLTLTLGRKITFQEILDIVIKEGVQDFDSRACRD